MKSPKTTFIHFGIYRQFGTLPRAIADIFNKGLYREKVAVDSSIITGVNDYIFLTKKIIGWLECNIELCLNLLIDILLHCDEKDEIIKLMFEDICRFYPDTTRRIYKTALEDNKYLNISSNINYILELIYDHFLELEEIKESIGLYPPISNQNVYMHNDMKIKADIREQAFKQSIFWETVSHKIILYKSRQINYVKHNNESRKVSKMHSYEFTYEIPMSKVYCPFDAYYKTIKYRSMRKHETNN